MQSAAAMTDVASDQQSAGRVLAVEVNRDVAPAGINPSWRFDLYTTPFGKRHRGEDLTP